MKEIFLDLKNEVLNKISILRSTNYNNHQFQSDEQREKFISNLDMIESHCNELDAETMDIDDFRDGCAGLHISIMAFNNILKIGYSENTDDFISLYERMKIAIAIIMECLEQEKNETENFFSDYDNEDDESLGNALKIKSLSALDEAILSYKQYDPCLKSPEEFKKGLGCSLVNAEMTVLMVEKLSKRIKEDGGL